VPGTKGATGHVISGLFVQSDYYCDNCMPLLDCVLSTVQFTGSSQVVDLCHLVTATKKLQIKSEFASGVIK